MNSKDVLKIYHFVLMNYFTCLIVDDCLDPKYFGKWEQSL